MAGLAKYSLSAPAVGVSMLAMMIALPSPVNAQEVRGAQAPQDGARGSLADARGVDEIIVTAQKREENLQSVPVAVTALTAENLERQRITNVGNLGTIVPNFTIVRQPSSPALPAFSLRGVISGETQSQVDGGVSVYVDGVYLGRSYGSMFDVADIERIEALRGPQGTLFGRNTTGGAINIITRSPPGEFGARQDIEIGNYNQLRTRTRIDLPAFGNIKATLGYLHREIDGYVRNLSAGVTRDYTEASEGRIGRSVAAKTLGAENSDSMFAAVRYDGDPLVVDYKFDYTDYRGSQLAYQALGFRGPEDLPGTNSLGPTVQAIFALQPGLGGTNIVSTRPLDAIHEPQRPIESLRTEGHSLTINYELSPSVSIRNIAAFRKLKQLSLGNGFEGNRLIDPFGGSGNDFTVLTSASNRQQEQKSNEIHIIAEVGAFDIVAGAFYFLETARVFHPSWFFLTFPPPGGQVTINPADVFQNVRVRNQSTAIFAQGSFEVTDSLKLTAGARQTWDKRREVDLRTTPETRSEASFNKPTWQVIAEYEPSVDILLYSKISTGYLSGGVFNGTPFEPEELIAYEVGVKGDFFDDMLRINAAAFISDYDNLQVSVFTGVLTYENAGKALIKGFELEASLAPMRGLRFNATLGLTDFKYKDYFSSALTGIPIDVSDIAQRPMTPKVTFNPSVVYETVPEPDGTYLSLSLDVPYRSTLRFANFPIADPEMARTFTSRAHWRANARFSVVDLPVRAARVRVSLWGQNIFNKRVIEHAADIGGFLAGSFNRPRTIGAEASLQF